MSQHRPEVADVFRTYEKDFFTRWGRVLSPHQRKAFAAIRDCRTAALGGHVKYVEQCDECGHRVISYNSCRNRHCPKCQASARPKWLTEREAELLPVPYFHVVFTLPETIGGLARQNAREIYGILFRPNAWARRSAFWPCCTPGDRNFIFIHTSTASCRAAASGRTGQAGLVAENNRSFFRFTCWESDSGMCF
jgi:hypothetical protein